MLDDKYRWWQAALGGLQQRHACLFPPPHGLCVEVVTYLFGLGVRWGLWKKADQFTGGSPPPCTAAAAGERCSGLTRPVRTARGTFKAATGEPGEAVVWEAWAWALA